MKKLIFIFAVLTIAFSSCRKDDFTEKLNNEAGETTTGITDMSDLLISDDFDWSLTKTINVQILLPEDDASRILYIYSEDGNRLYYKGHPQDGSNILETVVTIPTYEKSLRLKYGIGDNYSPIELGLNGTDLIYSISSLLNPTLKNGRSVGSFPDFGCITLWSVDDQPGKLHYTTLSDNSPTVQIEGDILGVNGTKDIESLAIDDNGNMYFVNIIGDSKLYKIPYSEIDKNPSTAVNAVYIGNTGVSGQTNKISSLTFIDGHLYGLGIKSEKVYEINTTNANLTQVGTLNYSGTFKSGGLTSGADGTVYLLFTKNTLSELWKFNSFPSGGITKVMDIVGSFKVESLAAHPNGDLYAADDFKWFKLDPVALTTEVVLNYSSDTEGLDFYWNNELNCVDCADDGDYTSTTFGGFQFDYDGMVENIDGTSTWTYTITGVAPSGPQYKDLSHWVLALCNNHNVTSGTPSGWEVNTDPTLNIFGIKWDEEINKTGGVETFSFTLDNQYDVEPVEVAFKAGQNLHYCTIFGPSCDETPDPPVVYLEGTVAFEDLWPSKGDYDLNDLVIEYDFEVTKDNNEMVESIEVTFEIRAFGAGFRNGFGFSFPNVSPSDIVSVSGYDIANTGQFSLASNGTENGQSKATFILYDDSFRIMEHPGIGIGVNTDPTAPYVSTETLVLNIEFANGAVTYSQLDIGNFNPFIVVDQNRGLEVHLPDYPATDLLNTNYFGTADDDTNPPNKYFLTENNLPWAIQIPERFNYPVEKQAIIGAYNHFAAWAQSGTFPRVHEDWYRDLLGYRNTSLLYDQP